MCARTGTDHHQRMRRERCVVVVLIRANCLCNVGDLLDGAHARALCCHRDKQRQLAGARARSYTYTRQEYAIIAWLTVSFTHTYAYINMFRIGQRDSVVCVFVYVCVGKRHMHACARPRAMTTTDEMWPAVIIIYYNIVIRTTCARDVRASSIKSIITSMNVRYLRVR